MMENEVNEEKNVFVKLPEDMDLEILSYLEDVDQESFIYTNKFLYDRFYVGKMRELKLQKWQNILHFLVYDDFRSQVLRRVKHPHKQLSLVFPNTYLVLTSQGLSQAKAFVAAKRASSRIPFLNSLQPSLSLRSHELSFSSSLKLHYLSISDVLYYQYFLTAVNRLTSLRLYRDEDQPSFLPRVLSSLQTHSTSLRLKELCLSGYQSQRLLPFIAGLEKVTLEFMDIFTSFHGDYFANTNKPGLKTIILNFCKVFYDLSMLGSVPSLTLIKCPKVQNIDALNKNESVMIDRCDMVVDYWRSFREVKDLTISCPRSLPSFNQMQYTMIASLTLTDICFRVQYPRAFPSILKKFVARRLNYFHPDIIESHSLEHVIIESCRHCSRAIVGLSEVKRIEFIDLFIEYVNCSTLNSFILIDNCRCINSFSFLSDIDTVCVRECTDVDLNQFNRIRNLSIIDCTLASTAGVLNNIHTLLLYPLDIYDKNFNYGLKKVVNLETPFHPLLFKYWSLERFTCEKLIVSQVEEKEWKEILAFWENEVNNKQKYSMMEYLRILKKVKFTLKKV
eukprot:gene8870-9607_t